MSTPAMDGRWPMPGGSSLPEKPSDNVGEDESICRLKKRVKHLVDELYTIHELFKAYEALYNKQASDVDVLNMAPGFFQLTIYSFIHWFAMMLSRMYDNDTNSNSLSNLINSISSNPHFISMGNQNVQETLDSCRILLSNDAEKAKQLKTLRDKVLAHNDLKRINHDMWEEIGLTIGDYRGMVTNAHDILCRIGNLLALPTPILGMRVENDIDYLISNLRSALNRKLEGLELDITQ